MDNKISCNWLVRLYDENKIVTSWVIKDRTEHEASREAEADPRVMDVENWTLTRNI